jgi:hypothetical protein
MSAEFDLLCLLLRPKPDLGRARLALEGGVDLATLVDLAAEHSVRPKLIEGLGALSWVAVPTRARNALATFHRLHCARVLGLCRELRRLAEALEQGKVPFAFFKGPVLATALHGDPSAREYTDIDVIVPERQYGAAERILSRLGYRAAQGSRPFRQTFLAYLRQYAFVHSDVDASIDLHWEFSGIHVPFPLAAGEIWGELGSVSVGGHAVPTLAGANLALLLAGHGTKEAWRSLQWICDFAMLMEAQPDLDWAEIHRRAQRRRCGDSILLACVMVQRLLGTPAAPDLSRPLEQSARVQALAASLIDGLRRGQPAAGQTENFSDLALCENGWDRARAKVTLVLSRTVGDYNAMPLPRPLWPVYHATRPFRLAAKAVASLRRQAGPLS